MSYCGVERLSPFFRSHPLTLNIEDGEGKAPISDLEMRNFSLLQQQNTVTIQSIHKQPFFLPPWFTCATNQWRDLGR